MGKLQIFDPALCCSTGVCGSEVDQALVEFSADVEWLKRSGGQIERFNLAQQPMAFAEHPVVKSFLEQSGAEGLPLVLLDGNLVLSGRYPSRDELSEWFGFATGPSIFTTQVAELVAIGAAVASNCEPCFKYHYDQARKLGVSNLDMRYAVDLAQKVKDTPAGNIQGMADRYLGPSTPVTAAKAGSCCAVAPAPCDKPACC
jgi:AhpD family alkylhydroperoxidase